MKAFILTTPSGFIDNPLIVSIHFNMFHGLSERNGVKNPLLEQYFIGTKLEYPLELIKNVYNPSNIIHPCYTLVVTQTIKDLLKDMPGIEFLQCKFKKLFEFPFKEGDFEFGGDKRFEYYSNAEATFKKFKHNPKLEAQIEPHYELILHLQDDLAKKYNYKGVDSISIPDVTGDIKIRVSAQMIKDFPMIGCRSDIIIREDVFKELEKHLNLVYFRVVPINCR